MDLNQAARDILIIIANSLYDRGIKGDLFTMEEVELIKKYLEKKG